MCTLIDTFTFFDNFTATDDPDYLTGEIASFFGFCLSGGLGSQRDAPETETRYQQQGPNFTK
jgi:hypothetical protein